MKTAKQLERELINAYMEERIYRLLSDEEKSIFAALKRRHTALASLDAVLAEGE